MLQRGHTRLFPDKRRRSGSLAGPSPEPDGVRDARRDGSGVAPQVHPYELAVVEFPVIAVKRAMAQYIEATGWSDRLLDRVCTVVALQPRCVGVLNSIDIVFVYHLLGVFLCIFTEDISPQEARVHCNQFFLARDIGVHDAWTLTRLVCAVAQSVVPGLMSGTPVSLAPTTASTAAASAAKSAAAPTLLGRSIPGSPQRAPQRAAVSCRVGAAGEPATPEYN